MENFRSKSCRDGRIQIEELYGNGAPKSMQDLRSYSVSYGYGYGGAPPTNTNTIKQQQPSQFGKELKIKKVKNNTNNNIGSFSKTWSFNDPELQRKKRVASYKVYAMEGKMKGSLRKSFRWIKDTCTHAVYGWR